MKHFLNQHSAFFILFIIAIGFIFMGFLLTKWPPKKINRFIGFRSKRSMRDQASWDFAQQYSGRMLMISGAILLLLSIPFLFVETSGNSVLLVLIPVFFITLFPIIKTENALKKFNP